MHWIWYVLMCLAFLLLAGLTLWLLVTVFSEKRRGKDNPLFINFLSSRDNKRFIGEQISIVQGKGGRHVVEIEPRDLGHDFEGPLVNEKIVVDSNKLIGAPKGSLSQDRNVNIGLPANIDDVPEVLKETVLGKGIIFMTGLKDLEKTVEDILREGTTRRDELLRKIGDGEISKEFINLQEGLIKNHLEKLITGKDSKSSAMPPGGMVPPGQHPM
jgi:hypothetical protein